MVHFYGSTIYEINHNATCTILYSYLRHITYYKISDETDLDPNKMYQLYCFTRLKLLFLISQFRYNLFRTFAFLSLHYYIGHLHVYCIYFIVHHNPLTVPHFNNTMKFNFSKPPQQSLKPNYTAKVCQAHGSFMLILSDTFTKYVGISYV